MKLAHVADSHARHANLDDWKRIHDQMLELWRGECVNLIVHAGDLYDGVSDPATRAVVHDWVRRAALVAPVVIVRGNHDQPFELQPLALLPNCHVSEHTLDVFVVGQFAVITVPWITKAFVVARYGGDSSAMAGDAEARAALRNMGVWIAAKSAELRKSGFIPVVAAHLTVSGCSTSTGQTLIGTGIEVSTQEIADWGAEYVALGHIHKFQGWNGGRIVYSGSPDRHNFGEQEAKGHVIVKFSNGAFDASTFWTLDARVIIDANYDWTPDSIEPFGVTKVGRVNGADVRIRIAVAADDAEKIDVGRIESEYIDAGARSARVELLIKHVARVRSETVAAAHGLEEKFWAYVETQMTDAMPSEAVTDEIRRILERDIRGGVQ